MKKTLGLVVAAGIFASAAMGANLNVSVESGGSNTITVGPGETVDYRVMGQLDTDADNRGLALVGFDLELLIEGTSTQADALPPADEPTGVEMLNFAVPEGINNPAGFGGTDSSGKLLQVGGAQNTINNTLDCTVDSDCPGASNLCDGGTCTASAPFPLGTVIENLGHTEIELAKGSLNAPAAEGTYVLTLTDLFANVISTTQNSPDFLATEAAGAGTVANLSITVQACVATATLASSNPASNGSLWRSAKNIMRLTFDADITVPDASEIEMVACRAECVEEAVDLSSFAIAVENPGSGPRVLKLQDPASNLEHRTWYKVRNSGWCVNPFEIQVLLQIGDADGNKFVTAADLGVINANQGGGFQPDDSRFDIDGNRFHTAADLGVTNAHMSSFVPNICCP